MRYTFSIIMSILVASASWAVTVEELAAQAALVLSEQAALDSLTSLSRAETLQATVDTDSTLAANSVLVLVSSIRPGSGVRDPDFVCLDVPRSTWGTIAQIRWDVAVAAYPVIATATAGRYLVHYRVAPTVLASVRAFVTSTNLEE